jgi:phenylalanine-4-hydroxylase
MALSTAARRDSFADPFKEYPATKQHNKQQAESGELRFKEVEPSCFIRLVSSARKVYNYYGDCAYADGFKVLLEHLDAVVVQFFC